MGEPIAVTTPGGQYRITVDEGALFSLGERIRELVSGSHIALVSDENVFALYGTTVRDALHSAGLDVAELLVPAGESSKSWSVAGELVERMAAEGLDRTDTVVALGGGVVGDLAGFCAGVYMRGIRIIHVPTTLLAQVDSSIGGKTAVDLTAGKNLAGVFTQPTAVIADTSTLVSLPDEEWRSGLAEVVKSAVLDGEEFLGWLETHASALLAREPAVVLEAVRRCAAFKARVVSADEREAGERESLNYGHTLGHAIEKVLGYGVVAHGVAVADGMRFAARLSERILGRSTGLVERQHALLDALGLTRRVKTLSVADVLSAMASDKKARSGSPRFVLVEHPGAFWVEQIDGAQLYAALNAWFSEGEEVS